MLSQYLPLLALLVLAVIFAALSFVASGLLAPRRPHDKKSAPYECGIIPSHDTPGRFPVRFFLVAMIFIVFDIEIIFFYPWAIAHREIGLFGLVAILIFSLAVFESFLYLIGNGALEWGPAVERRRALSRHLAGEVVKPGVRQVGLEGRDFVGTENTDTGEEE